MDFFKAAPEQLAKYVDFLATFSRSPRQALGPYTTTDSSAGQNVSSQLLLYVALSVGLAMLLNQIGAAVGMAPDSSWTVTAVGRIDEKARPLAAAALVVIIAVVWHGLAKTVAWLLTRVSKELPFRGDVAGSINASLAVATWFIPLFMLVIIVIRIAALRVALPVWLLLIAVVPVGLVFPIYFVLSFAATQRLSVGHAADPRRRNIGWRLDYVLASASLARALTSTVLREFGSRDHGAVITTFAEPVTAGGRERLERAAGA